MAYIYTDANGNILTDANGAILASTSNIDLDLNIHRHKPYVYTNGQFKQMKLIRIIPETSELTINGNILTINEDILSSYNGNVTSRIHKVVIF